MFQSDAEIYQELFSSDSDEDVHDSAEDIDSDRSAPVIDFSENLSNEEDKYSESRLVDGNLGNADASQLERVMTNVAVWAVTLATLMPLSCCHHNLLLQHNQLLLLPAGFSLIVYTLLVILYSLMYVKEFKVVVALLKHQGGRLFSFISLQMKCRIF